ncbi:amino acid ABC transporter permease [Paenibacillus psychroresistens]|uniref:Amino acid ABC transporter permease n=1 Tax=Paenibacillus psychroresistens TaxID=1778678 RepID=A0A6B8REM3_9BACL|nr:amino acid ABC transporter permease [Paenibacillus psychroresistens]QGQ93922.1 amino acid ABC transporter permease [Paenibacillus psychroresistens]
MMHFSILFDNWDVFLTGFGNTLKSSLLALIGSFILGNFLAIMRLSTYRILRVISSGYIEFVRNIPLLLIVLIFFLAFPSMGIPLDGFTAGTIGLTVYTAAFIAEVLRAGILSIESGQTEAARASGLTYFQTLRFVILPQAIKIVIPPLGNQFLNLVKNSSVLSIVSGFDLMYYGDIIASETFVTFDVYIFVAVFYLILTIPLSFAVRYMESRLARNY